MLEVVVICSSTLLGKRMTLFAAITLGLSHRQWSDGPEGRLPK